MGNRRKRGPSATPKSGPLPAYCRLGQEPRRPFMPEMVLVIVMETKATIANARRTTTTGAPLLDTGKKGRYASKVNLCVFNDLLVDRANLRRQKRTSVALKAHFSRNSTD